MIPDLLQVGKGVTVGDSIHQRDQRKEFTPQLAQGLLSGNPLGAIWQCWWIILLMIGLSLIWGHSQYKKIIPKYISSSRVYVDRRGPRLIDDIETGPMTGSSDYLDTQAQLIKSSSVLELAIASPDLKHLKTFADMEDPRPALRSSLRTTVIRNNGFIDVSFSSVYPAESASIVNAVVQAYVDFYIQSKKSNSAEILNILQKEKAKRDVELSEKLRAMTEFKQSHDSLSFETGNGNVALSRLDNLSSKLNQVEVLALEVKSFYEKAKTMADNPELLRLFIESQSNFGSQFVSETKNTARLHIRLERIEERRYEMRMVGLAASHPDMVALDQDINELNKALGIGEESYAPRQLSAIEQHYQVLTERQKWLEQAIREFPASLFEINFPGAILYVVNNNFVK